MKFFRSIFHVFKRKDNRKAFIYNLKIILLNFLKKLFILKKLHVSFNKIINSLPKENKNYFFTTLNKAKTSRQENNLEESKNYFYIVVTIFISLSAMTLFYKNRHKIIGFLRKIGKK